jgi:hypothetical protein
MDYQISNWADIKEDYCDSILLGNGASISIDSVFSYSSLREHAIGNGLLQNNVESLFDYFKTDDFELILRLVWQASKVNQALNIRDRITKKAYEHVRDCLIEAVRSIHPEYFEVEDQLDCIGLFLSDFDTVLSLNYDLTLYWVIMRANRNKNGHIFKDCFVSGGFDEDWLKFREPLSKQQKYITLVFYPHGNLALARNIVDREVKLSNGSGMDLLSSIFCDWTSGDYIPLFVSEGTSDQKIHSIQNSHYLHTIYREVLPDLGDSLVIYGWGLGEHDLHIINRIRVSGVSRIAVSVYGRDQVYCRRVHQILLDAFGSGIDIEFFDSQSKGCWNN